MIPIDYITEWRQRAPWAQDSQVEQDLIISRALIEIFQQPEVGRALAFRGGTALYKLHFSTALRYSEDIDLVQIAPGPIGGVLDAIRGALDPWLGVPKRTFKEGRVTLFYRMLSEDSPPLRMRMKIEVNTGEHFSVLGVRETRFDVHSRWFSGSAAISTYDLNELLGTKLRALYQRRKGRDLFDRWMTRGRDDVDPDRLVDCFGRYLDRQGQRVTRAQFEANLAAKLEDSEFVSDMTPLLGLGTTWNVAEAATYVRDELISRLPGLSWKGSGE